MSRAQPPPTLPSPSHTGYFPKAKEKDIMDTYTSYNVCWVSWCSLFYCIILYRYRCRHHIVPHPRRTVAVRPLEQTFLLAWAHNPHTVSWAININWIINEMYCLFCKVVTTVPYQAVLEKSYKSKLLTYKTISFKQNLLIVSSLWFSVSHE